jgi:pyridoxal phosphate enzyme (YggS family)
LIHSVDSCRLLECIERVSGELHLQSRVLLEVNLSGEAAKHGFQESDLITDWEQIQQTQHVRIEGLMTMAAYSDNSEDARPVFSRLRDLKNELRLKATPQFAERFQHLSMGMSGDFEVAIEEGATLVRIGSALWNGLTVPPDSAPA